MHNSHNQGKYRKARTSKKVNETSQNAQMSSTNSTNTTEQQSADERPEDKIVRKAYEIAPEWKISTIAKRRFMNLPSAFQNSVGKEACIKEALASHKDLIPDPTRYWIWLVDETNKLTRVWDFAETCEAAGLNPLTVAQHLILEGKAVCNAIRMEGLVAYGSNIRMFVDPLFQDEFKLFGNKFAMSNLENQAANE